MPATMTPWRIAALLLPIALLAGCQQATTAAGQAAGAAAGRAAGAAAGAAGPAAAPAAGAAGQAAQAAATPAAQQLAQMTAAAAQGAWDRITEAPAPTCTGDADKPCAETQALRARACRQQAASAPADRKMTLLDCAVTAGQAALAAGGANTAAERNAWREELLGAAFDRRAITPRANSCPGNDLLRAEADTLRRDMPGNANARFYAASARMYGVSVSCGSDDQRCPDLAEAARLLTPPQSDPRWAQTLEGVRTLQRVVVGCPEG